MFEPLPGSRMRRRIYLMRHGEVSYFDDQGVQVDADMVNLTADGRAQAAAMGEFLADVPFDAAYCTGLPRTEQTALGALGGRDLELQVRAPLREISAGDMSGMSKEEVKHNFIHVFARLGEPGLVYGRGEVIQNFADRVTGDIAKLALELGHALAEARHEGVVFGGLIGMGIEARDRDVIDPRVEVAPQQRGHGIQRVISRRPGFGHAALLGGAAHECLHVP